MYPKQKAGDFLRPLYSQNHSAPDMLQLTSGVDNLERHTNKQSHRRYRVVDHAPGLVDEIDLIVAYKDAIHLIRCA